MMELLRTSCIAYFNKKNPCLLHYNMFSDIKHNKNLISCLGTPIYPTSCSETTTNNKCNWIFIPLIQILCYIHSDSSNTMNLYFFCLLYVAVTIWICTSFCLLYVAVETEEKTVDKRCGKSICERPFNGIMAHPIPVFWMRYV